MIRGTVNDRREPIIPVTIYGFGGKPLTVEAVIDTGFDDFLTLPLENIATLALAANKIMSVMLSDGSVIQAMHFDAEVDWHGKRVPVLVQAAAGKPLVGMALLEGSRLIVEADEGGQVLVQQRRKRG
jgi:clan AA aspartic protease